MRALTRLKREQRGATAIEYAIIAGLIGLGLVGSLVTTRGSLSGIFGTAGTQMNGATATKPPVAPSPSAGTWTAKGLTSAVTTASSSTGAAYTFTFGDGTVVDYAQSFGADGKVTGSNAAVKTFTNGYASHIDNYYMDGNGTVQGITIVDYYSNGRPSQTAQASASAFVGDFYYYRTDGSSMGSCYQCFTPTTQDRQSRGNDALYFAGLASQQ